MTNARRPIPIDRSNRQGTHREQGRTGGVIELSVKTRSEGGRVINTNAYFGIERVEYIVAKHSGACRAVLHVTPIYLR